MPGTTTSLDMMRREIAAIYTTPDMRAAYRAGMSTAAAICDEWAAAVELRSPGRRRRGSASDVGASVARGCGGAIWDARNEITISD